MNIALTTLGRIQELEQQFLELTQTDVTGMSLDDQFELINKVNKIRIKLNNLQANGNKYR